MFAARQTGLSAKEPLAAVDISAPPIPTTVPYATPPANPASKLESIRRQMSLRNFGPKAPSLQKMRFAAIADEISEVDEGRHRINGRLWAQLSENTQEWSFGLMETQMP